MKLEIDRMLYLYLLFSQTFHQMLSKISNREKTEILFQFSERKNGARSGAEIRTAEKNLPPQISAAAGRVVLTKSTPGFAGGPK